MTDYSFRVHKDINAYDLVICKNEKVYIRFVHINEKNSEEEERKIIDDNFSIMLRKINRKEKNKKVKAKVLSLFKK